MQTLGNAFQRAFSRSPSISTDSTASVVESEIQQPLERKDSTAQQIKASKLVNKIAINFLYYFPQQLGFVMEYVFLFISNQPFLVTSAGLSNTLVETLLIVPVFSLNLGLSTLVSQAVGATQFGVAGFYLLRSILINLVVFTSCSFLLTYSSTVMSWMGSSTVVVEEATKFVTFGFISSVIACIFDLMRNFIQAHQIFRIPALVQCCCTLGLLFLEFIVVKLFGCGLIGLGICKIIGETAKSVTLIWYVRRAPKLRQSIVSFRKDYFHLHVLWIQMKKQSFAGSLFFLDWFGFLLMCFVVSGLESNDVSSFFVSFTIITLFNSFADSISAPLGVMIGHAAGGGNVDKVRLFIKVGFIWGAVVAVLVSLTMSVARDALPWMFTTKDEVAAKSSNILYSFCWVFPFYMLQNIMVAIFRSLGKEKAASFLLFLSIYVIGIPCSALLGYPLKLGVYGVRYGYAIGIFTNAFFFAKMLWQMKIEDQVNIVSDQLKLDDQKNNELIEIVRLQEQRGEIQSEPKPDNENPPVQQEHDGSNVEQRQGINLENLENPQAANPMDKEFHDNNKFNGVSDINQSHGTKATPTQDNSIEIQINNTETSGIHLTDSKEFELKQQEFTNKIPSSLSSETTSASKAQEKPDSNDTKPALEAAARKRKSKKYATLVEDHPQDEKNEVEEANLSDNDEVVNESKI